MRYWRVCHSPRSHRYKLQLITNFAVRLVAELGPRDRVTESLKVLYWLLVQYRIKFNLCVMMHSVVDGTSPVYIKDFVTPTRETHGRSYLQSAAEGNYNVSRFNTELARRAFPAAAQFEWNALPANIKTIVDKDCFKKAPKTLFRRACNC